MEFGGHDEGKQTENCLLPLLMYIIHYSMYSYYKGQQQCSRTIMFSLQVASIIGLMSTES